MMGLGSSKARSLEKKFALSRRKYECLYQFLHCGCDKYYDRRQLQEGRIYLASGSKERDPHGGGMAARDPSGKLGYYMLCVYRKQRTRRK